MKIGTSIRKTTIYIFITTVILMVFIALLAVWGVLAEDSLWRAVSTVVIIGGAAGVISMAADYLDRDHTNPQSRPPVDRPDLT